MTLAPLLQIDGLHVAFGARDRWREVVRGVDLRLLPGEVVGLVGESGSGKSLTALSIMRLLPPGARISSGRITFAGTDLATLSDRAINARRGGDIGMIFQDPLTALNPAIAVGRQIVDSLRTHQEIGRTAAWARAVELLDLVGIHRPAERAHAYAHELSGGMRQRVMTALAVCNDPKLLIADEPTTALDVTVQAQVIAMLDRIRRELGIAVLFISHNLDLVAESSIASRSCTPAGSWKAARSRTSSTRRNTRIRVSCCAASRGWTVRPDRCRRSPVFRPGWAAELSGCAFASRCQVVQERCRLEMPPIRRRDGHLSACWETPA